MIYRWLKQQFLYKLTVNLNVEETGGSRENLPQAIDKLYHIKLYM
jgi:hypothetical protein